MSTSTTHSQPQPPPPRTSPSPPPLPPSTTTTSYTSPRLQALHSIFRSALTHTLSANSYAAFSRCFPTPARHAPAILESVWRQVTAMMERKCWGEFEEILAEKRVAEGLVGLERVVERGRREMLKNGGGGQKGGGDENGEVVPPHMLPPEELYLAHLRPWLGEMERGVREEMEGLRRENEVLVRAIESQRREVEGLVGGVEGAVGDLEGANLVMGEIEDVRREAVEVNQEMMRDAR